MVIPTFISIGVSNVSKNKQKKYILKKHYKKGFGVFFSESFEFYLHTYTRGENVVIPTFIVLTPYLHLTYIPTPAL